LVNKYLLITIILIVNPIFQNKYFPDSPEILPGILPAYNGEYDKAFQYWDLQIAKYPEAPEWYFFKASTLLCKIEDMGDYSLKKDFLEIISHVLENTDKEKDKYKKHFYRGLAFGYRGALKLETGNTLSGMRDGLRSSNELEKCIAIKKEMDYPYIFLGIYKYWKSKSLRSLNWLPGIADDRIKGIELIKNHLNTDSPLYYFNLNQLAWIYIDQKYYDEAISLLEECSARFPDSRFFLYPLAEAHGNKKDFERALKYFSKIKESFEQNNFLNVYSYYKVNVKIAEILYQQNRLDESLDYIDRVFDLIITNTPFYGKKKIVKWAQDLKKKINSKDNSH